MINVELVIPWIDAPGENTIQYIIETATMIEMRAHIQTITECKKQTFRRTLASPPRASTGVLVPRATERPAPGATTPRRRRATVPRGPLEGDARVALALEAHITLFRRTLASPHVRVLVPRATKRPAPGATARQARWSTVPRGPCLTRGHLLILPNGCRR